jgi:dienelactone hydrolase
MAGRPGDTGVLYPHHLGPATATVRGVDLSYEVFGGYLGYPTGATPREQGVVVMHGGQSGRAESRLFAEALAAACAAAACPVRVLILDRRNMGTSGVKFDGAEGLPREEAEDVHALIGLLDLGPC